MLLRHATLRKNLPSIDELGLLCSKSKGRKKVVWVHAAGKSAWATLHTVRRHGGRVEDVVLITVDVPRRFLRRSRRGLWYCLVDVPPERFRDLITFTALARSPVDDAAPLAC